MGSRGSEGLVGGGATLFLIVVTTVEEDGLGFLSGGCKEVVVDAVGPVRVPLDVDLVVEVVGGAFPPKKLIMAAERS